MDHEKYKIVKKYQEIQEKVDNELVPSHEWVFQKLDRKMVKNDDPFIHNNAVWKLMVTYNRQIDTTLKVNLNLAVNPFQDKNARIYFKKNEFFLPSNSSILNDQ